MTDEPLLRIDGLSVRFDGNPDSAPAVDDVSLSIRQGETLGLVGESGSGKSLTAMAALGLAPTAARIQARGGLFWRRDRIDDKSESWLRRLRGGQIGVVFQEPAGCLNPLLTIGRQVAESVPAAKDRARRVAALLNEVGLEPGMIRRYPHELSGGQQQRVMIAIALAADPALLIADEPTTALDVTIQAQIVALLQDLKARRRMALLFISHDLALVSAMADRVAIMRKGRIVEEGPAQALFASPQNPYTRALLAARPGHGPSPARLPTIDALLGERDALEPPPRAAIGETALEIQDLRVEHPGRGWFARPFRAVDGVSLTLCAGESLGLVGESGSGKSTLARAVMGLIKPISGKIALFGSERDRSVGHPRCQIIFQDSGGSLNPRLTVRSILSEPLDLRGLHPGSARADRLAASLAEVALEPFHLDRYPHELSGGQRQRVNIARALTLDPEILICDEIVSALDVTVQAQVLNLLKDIQSRRALALLFISHDLAVVRFIADRVAVMKDGKIVESGPTLDMLDNPRHPYARQLMAAIPRLAVSP
jgi:peptide/nickel transport system ATP-binding protein